MLFSFNDEFIAEMCGGLNDDDTSALFIDGLEAMIAETEEALARTVGRPVEVKLEDDMLVAKMTDQEADEEFGAPGVMMKASFRQGFIQATHGARQAFDKVVNDHA